MKDIKLIQADLIWAATKYGAFQRSKIYRSDADESSKRVVRKAIYEYLYSNIFRKFYKLKITSDENVTLICNLLHLLKTKHKDIVDVKTFSFGNAQKFVNLYIKCMWIVGLLKVPPHFPIDGIIIKALGLSIKWTSLTQAQYEIVITKTKDRIIKSKYKNIAEWEAHEYHESRNRKII